LLAVGLIVTHDRDPHGRVVRSVSDFKTPECVEVRAERDAARREGRQVGRQFITVGHSCDVMNPEPYPGEAWAALAAGAVAWVTGRGLRFILKGD
jgi:hypothetical protein